MLWLEPLAQHFPFSRRGDGRFNSHVQPLLRHPGGKAAMQRLATANVTCVRTQNGSVPPALLAARAPLRAARGAAVHVPLWEWSAALDPSLHPGPKVATPTAFSMDCAHYCLPSGVVDAVLDVILWEASRPIELDRAGADRHEYVRSSGRV